MTWEEDVPHHAQIFTIIIILLKNKKCIKKRGLCDFLIFISVDLSIDIMHFLIP